MLLFPTDLKVLDTDSRSVFQLDILYVTYGHTSWKLPRQSVQCCRRVSQHRPQVLGMASDHGEHPCLEYNNIHIQPNESNEDQAQDSLIELRIPWSGSLSSSGFPWSGRARCPQGHSHLAKCMKHTIDHTNNESRQIKHIRDTWQEIATRSWSPRTNSLSLYNIYIYIYIYIYRERDVFSLSLSLYIYIYIHPIDQTN